MSYTIFSKSAAFPVAIGGSKIVKTFPSGLVLVSQEYAVPRGQEDTYAAAFAVGQPLAVDSPAIDGLYIFPEPEWRDSGDGFTRLTVSAYGRWNSTGQTEKGTVDWYCLISFLQRTFGMVTNFVQYGYTRAILPRFIQRIVLTNSEFQSGGFILQQQNTQPLFIEADYFGLNAGGVYKNLIPYAVAEPWIIDIMANGPGTTANPKTINYAGKSYIISFSTLLPPGDFVSSPTLTKLSDLEVERIDTSHFGFFSEYTITYKSSFELVFR